MNNDIKYRNINVANAVRLYDGSHVGDDILLFDDITSVLVGKDPRRMQSLFLAMCVKGHASYFVDSVAHTVGPGDIIIVSKGRVTYDYTLSPDCQAIGILIDYDFFKDTIKSVHELSALFLFARNHPVFHLPDDKAEEITDIFFRMKRKMDAADNHFLREMVQSMFLTLVYEMCDEIYKVQTHSPTHNTRAEEIFTTSSRLWRATSVRNVVWDGIRSSSASRRNTFQRPSRRCRSARLTNGLTRTSSWSCACFSVHRREA